MSNVATKTTVKGILESENVKGRLQEILGKNAPVFATSVIQISQTPALSKCDPASIVGAAMTSATLNLPINNMLGYSYIIPFGDKATYQIGYKGFIQLAMRSGQFKTIHCTDVRVGEVTNRDRLTGEMEFQWEDDDQKREQMKKAGYVAYFKLVNGYEATLYMSMDELTAHGKKFSQTFKRGGGLWNTDFDSMAQKTVLKLLLSKKAPLSIDMQTAVKTDQASFNNIDDAEDISYIDNEPLEPEIDHEYERMKLLVDDVKTMEDAEFAQEHVTDPVLIAELDLKIIQIKKAAKTDKK